MRGTIIFLYFILFNSILNAQDIHFSQFYMNPLLQNPAMAGVGDDFRAIIQYRSQWQTFSPFKTFSVSTDTKMISEDMMRRKKGFLAMGVNFFSDQSGDIGLRTIQGALSLAYHLKINSTQTVGLGIQGGFFNRSIAPDDISTGSQYIGYYDESLPTGEYIEQYSFIKPDVATGVVWSYESGKGNRVVMGPNIKANAGFAVYHYHRPNYSFIANATDKLHPKFVFHGDATIPISNSKIGVKPSYVFYKQGAFQELLIGSLIGYIYSEGTKMTGFIAEGSLFLGAHYRVGDALVSSLLVKYGNFVVGLSYDFTTSDLNKGYRGTGAFEVSLKYIASSPFSSSGYKVKFR